MSCNGQLVARIDAETEFAVIASSCAQYVCVNFQPRGRYRLQEFEVIVETAMQKAGTPQ